MSTHRHLDAICVAVLIVTLLITVLFMNGEALGIRVIVDEDAEEHGGETWFTANDRNGEWDSSGATVVRLEGENATVTGGGAYVLNGDVVISSAGKYVLSGTLDDGSIIVDTTKKAKVWILLDEADISCSDGPCLDVEQADKVFLTLAAGTENHMSASAFSAESQAQGEDGTVFARDDLTVNGSGSLTVLAPASHGIVGNDDLVIAGGRVSVEAAYDALHANDSLHLAAAELVLTAGDDGIGVTGVESVYYQESGTVTVTAGDKGVNAAGTILIADGTLTLETGDDGISAAGDIRMENGSITLSAGDDGIHSDSGVVIAGGTLSIPACYEGIEARTIDISGGDITIYPEDDGLNANGGTTGFGMPGGMPGAMSELPGEMQGKVPGAMPEGMEEGGPPAMPEPPGGIGFGEEIAPPAETETGSSSSDTGETWIHISGGNLTVVNDSAQDADGLDSNGDIIISGGNIRVSLVNSGSNSALDCGSESGGIMQISGGTVVACGSYAMAESFDSSSTQCAILYNSSYGAAAGKTVSLENSEGNVLISYDVPCSFSSVAISCPEMQLGETYTVVIGDTAEEITLNEISASYGNVESEGFDGNMNWGGGLQFRPHTVMPFGDRQNRRPEVSAEGGDTE